MMTSKERAELRAQANPLDVTLIVGKGGISDTLLDEAVVLLDSHELVKGRVLETSGLTAREASDAICEALGAEGVACVGTKFVIWRKSEKVEQEKKKAAAKKPAKKVSGNYNPVKAGLRARKQAAEQQRKQRKHIVGTSQLFMRVAKPLREQVKRIVMCQCKWGLLQINTEIDGTTARETPEGLDADVLGTYMFWHTPQLYACYDTYAKMKRYKGEWNGHASQTAALVDGGARSPYKLGPRRLGGAPK